MKLYLALFSIAALTMITPALAGAYVSEEGDVFDILPTATKELSISAQKWRLIAYKWDENSDRYQIAFFEQGKPLPQICASGAKFSALLKTLSTLKAKNLKSPDETKALVQSGQEPSIGLEYVPYGTMETERWRIYSSSTGHPTLIMVDEDLRGRAFEPSWSQNIFASLGQGCRVLGQR